MTTQNNSHRHSRITQIVAIGLGCISGLAGQTVSAGSIDISDVPLYVVQGVEPNIILTMDDSGSMAWSFMPDSIYGYRTTNRAKSSTFNGMYYNPDVQYLPPLKADGTSYPDASFTAAWRDGFDTGAGTVNLSTSFRPTWYYSWTSTAYAGSAEPAYYYQYDGSGSTNSDSNYDKNIVSSTSSPTGGDERTNFANWYSYYRNRQLLAKSAASRAFANLSENVRVARQALNRSTSINTLTKFTGAGRSAFFSWLANVDASGSTPLLGAIERAGEEYEEDSPYRDNPSDSDSTMRSCRQNFHVAMTDGYWNGGYGVSGNKDNSSFTLPANSFGITSYSPKAPYRDGNSSNAADNAFYYWVRDLKDSLENNVPTYIVNSDSDFDGDGTAGEPEDIFWDPRNDPANWQHMVNFTVGLGVNGNLDYPGDYAALLAGTKGWGTTSPDAQANVDDLWHAAINSRGQYFSAANPQELVDAFSSVLNSITDRTGSAAPLALNAGTVASDTKVFQVRFNTGDWTGELRALPISDGTGNETCTVSDPVGAVCTMPVWEAACALDGGPCTATGSTSGGLDWDSDREIITFNPSTGSGAAFRWANLDATSGSQRDLLDSADGEGQARVAYLRGDQGCEIGSTGACGHDIDDDGSTTSADKQFRTRSSLLGDMINSNPVYVGPPLRVYPASLESASYTTFKSTNSGRSPMVYAGANDGMLHAFDATTGEEKLAYIPNAVFGNLVNLTSTAYGHKNYVDGPLVEGDVFYDSTWHTVLVGGLGLGGQAVFSLDITDPGGFGESNAANIAKWEFSDRNDSDMGFSMGKPVIVRLNTGKWAAVFGNGYNNTAPDGRVSSTGDAVLYIVDIEDGSLIKKLSTETGTADDPTGDGRPNGLGSVTAVDINRDFKTDYIYAGDMFGNVWKFDLCQADAYNNCTVTSSAGFDVAYSGGTPAAPKPVYTAKDSSGRHQPITTEISVGFHPTGTGLVAYFGTGKYLGTGDLSDSSDQTFYGVWDKGTGTANLPVDRSHLLQQTVVETNLTQFTGVDARFTSDNEIRWHTTSGTPASGSHLGWYIDLTESGERVHQAPLLRSGRIIFVTVTPSSDPCSAGGSSWLMELNATDGARLDFSPFDYNNDGAIDRSDWVAQTSLDLNSDGEINSDDLGTGSGIRQKTGGILTSPAVLMLPDNEQKMMSTSGGAILSVGEEDGRESRRSWRQIR